MEQTHGRIYGRYGQNAPSPGKRETMPPLVGAGGALVGLGLGFGWPGIIIGGIIGLAMGLFAAKQNKNKAGR